MPPPNATTHILPSLSYAAQPTAPAVQAPAPQPSAMQISASVQTPSTLPLAVMIPAALPTTVQSLEAATVPSGLNAGLADVTGAGAIGLFLGDGVMPIPQKLVNKILALEYVEMRLLLPESWLYEENGTHCCDKRDRSKKPENRSIFPWLQSFSAMVGVLASRYSHKVAQLMAYQATIIKCYTDFEGSAWMAYDRAYRRQAAAKKSLDWSQLNPTLYSLCFAGRAKRDLVCTNCLSHDHKSEDCSEAGRPNKFRDRPRYSNTRNDSSAELCRLFNARGGSKCRFKECKYAHLCKECKRPHPWSACSTNTAPETKKV